MSTAKGLSTVGLRICPFCESTCGLRITLQGDRVERVEGNPEDLFSRGYLCPKGANIANASDDPDRLTTPLVRRGGQFEPATWDDAFARIRQGIGEIRSQYGKDAVGVYVGNPNSHNLAAPLYLRHVIKAVGSRNLFSPATADQVPTQVACARMYGSSKAVPVPDVDRTDFLLIFGANPMVSNGSLCTAPNFPARLRTLRARGGRIIVVDPRTTATAAMADQHLAIRPATDVWLLLAIIKHLFETNSTRMGTLTSRVTNLSKLRELTEQVDMAGVALRCGVDEASIIELCRAVAEAGVVAAYGRIGTCTVRHGTLTNWLIQCVNVLTGSLDAEGGMMFPISPVRPRQNPPAPFRIGRWHSRVRQLPEIFSELPVSTFVDEVVTPGEGQIRGLVTVAGNPVLSAPQGGRLSAALPGLDFMVSVDPYINETTAHADVVLPPPPLLSTGHYDWSLSGYFVRAVVRYTPPVRPIPDGMLSDEDVLCRLADSLAAEPWQQTPVAFRERALMNDLAAAVADPDSAVSDRDAAELRALLGGTTDPERRLDAALRLGPFGDHFGTRSSGLSLARLLEHPEGIDFGPMVARLDEVVTNPRGVIDLFPPEFAAEVRSLLVEPAESGLVLVGRRQLRSNNSWLHNVPKLVQGKVDCTLVMNESDADERGLSHGELVRVESRAGEITVVLEVSREIRRGVVSLPHGWGHDVPGSRLRVATNRPGSNANDLIDELPLDAQSGAAVMNGVPVQVRTIQ